MRITKSTKQFNGQPCYEVVKCGRGKNKVFITEQQAQHYINTFIIQSKRPEHVTEGLRHFLGLRNQYK